ncbi:hypothetical protein [Tropicibacter oceani]|uniref:Uncharacterized protein n=1 Tax=Tropicibacter oceani TaxID=3058420 RepID=A0ABY8QMW4_9RHOB|nr:hypothetical protein [Tropicibacter oceani]WGW05127.1 hypothetical protein QF118_06175 [Tropicibacter oceani]
MGTQAAMMMALATVGLLLPLVLIKYYVKKVTMEKDGEQAAYRRNEAGRLMIMTAMSALMFGLVIAFGSQVVAPEMMAAVH